MSTPTQAPAHPVTVLLVDDQVIVGEAVRRMLAPEKDIVFHHCADPAQAIDRANAVAPTVILLDLVMPEIDGMTLARFFRANPATRDVPLIVLSTKEEATTKAEAFAGGANDYLVKLPDRIELIARIRYHSKGYIHLLERNEAYRKLEESQRALAAEVAEAAKYVVSLLPPPLRGPVEIDWRFIPSTQLGGDSFGYHWLDPDHLALYLLDVSGHGVGPSLLSVSVMNVLGSQSLPGVDFREPSQVVARLNNTFPMEKQHGNYFTMWYGVYRKSSRQLTYAGGGHPPALLLTGPDRGAATLKRLESQGAAVGIIPDFEFPSDTCDLGAFARLYLYSDGVFEILRPDESMWSLDEFVSFMAALPPDEAAPINRLLEHVRQMHGSPALADDFSMLQLTC
jgi:sigma-B regulation protein RsbU (phosphoserine phosphatase)